MGGGLIGWVCWLRGVVVVVVVEVGWLLLAHNVIISYRRAGVSTGEKTEASHSFLESIIMPPKKKSPSDPSQKKKKEKKKRENKKKKKQNKTKQNKNKKQNKIPDKNMTYRTYET